MTRLLLLTTLIYSLFLTSGQNPTEAADKPTLVIYTYDGFAAEWGPAPKVKAEFEKTCDCVLDFVATDTSIGILRKIQLEGKNTKADIALGLDTNLIDVANKTGLFAPHGATFSNSALPIEWKEKTFLPFDYGHFAFVYNTEKLKNPPNSFEQLAETGEDFKIVIQDPRSSTPGLGLLLWVKELYGDKAVEMWKKLSPKILTITKGWSESYKLFLKGEADMVLSYTTSPAYHLIAEEDERFKASIFDQGHYLQVEVAAMLKSSKQPKLARRFMQFVVSDRFQSIIPTTNWMFPATNPHPPLPSQFETLAQPNRTLLTDSAVVEKNRKNWISEWQTAVTR